MGHREEEHPQPTLSIRAPHREQEDNSVIFTRGHSRRDLTWHKKYNGRDRGPIQMLAFQVQTSSKLQLLNLLVMSRAAPSALLRKALQTAEFQLASSLHESGR